MLPSPFKIIQEYSVVWCLLHYMTAHKWGWGILLCHMTQLVMARHSCTKDISMAANSFAVWQECSSSESIFSNLTLWQEKEITQLTKLLLWELSQVGWCRCGTRWGVVLDKCKCGHEKPLTSRCYLGNLQWDMITTYHEWRGTMVSATGRCGRLNNVPNITTKVKEVQLYFSLRQYCCFKVMMNCCG